MAFEIPPKVIIFVVVAAILITFVGSIFFCKMFNFCWGQMICNVIGAKLVGIGGINPISIVCAFLPF